MQWYKIFWRVVGSMDANKNETDKLEFRFPADDDKIYEILVKVRTVVFPVLVCTHARSDGPLNQRNH